MFAIYTGNTDTYTRGISSMQRIQGYQIFMMATWERDIGETEGYQIFIMFAIHRQHRHVYKGNFVHAKHTRLSDIMMATWEGYRRNRAIKYS
jgi:hypothetical protein